MNKKKKKKKIDQVVADAEIRIECLPDDTPIRGHAMASGDDAIDRRAEDDILANLPFNEWAWCLVKVTAIGPAGVIGTDYLGACSYANESDFRQPGGYFDDMVDRAREDLRRQLMAVADVLS